MFLAEPSEIGKKRVFPEKLAYHQTRCQGYSVFRIRVGRGKSEILAFRKLTIFEEA